MYLYRPGYRLVGDLVKFGEDSVMKADSSVPAERIGYIRQVMARADCGQDSESIANRLRIYRAMYSEARQLATSQSDKKQLNQILFWIELIEVGQEQALANLNARESSR